MKDLLSVDQGITCPIPPDREGVISLNNKEQHYGE
jgi:hypothetical protein